MVHQARRGFVLVVVLLGCSSMLGCRDGRAVAEPGEDGGTGGDTDSDTDTDSDADTDTDTDSDTDTDTDVDADTDSDTDTETTTDTDTGTGTDDDCPFECVEICYEILHPEYECFGWLECCEFPDTDTETATDSDSDTAACASNAECDELDYCFKESCDDPTGTCETRPEICTPMYDPVCTCDAMTYDNACNAASAGKNIDYVGVCT